MKQEEASRPSVRSEELFRLVAENVEDFAIFAVDLDGNVASWNPGVEKLLGYAEGEWVGRDACIIFTPEDNERDACGREMRTAGEIGRAEDQRWHVRKDGTRFWANGVMMALRDDAGRLRGFAKVMRDETARKLTEDRLRESEERFQRLVDLSPDAIAVHAGGVLLFINTAGAKLLRAEGPEQLVGRPIAELIHPDYHGIIRERIEKASRGEASPPAEIKFIRLDGTELYGELASAPLLYQGKPALQAVVRDLTRRRRDEEALRESERRFRLIFDQQFQFMAILAPEGVLLDVNELPLRAAGVTREQVLGNPFWETPWWEGLPEMRAGWPARLAEAARSDSPVFSVDLYQAAGVTRVAEASITAVKDPDGRVEFFIVQATDITERKEAEEALRESAERFRFLAESMPQKIFTAKPNGDVDYFNRQWTEFTGLSFEQIRDWGWTQFIHPEDVGENVRRWRHSVDTGEPFQFEHRFRRADGEYRWHLSRAHAMRDSEGGVVMWIGSNTDIDDMKRAGEERERLLRREQGAREEAERANRLKDEFLATLSHELRTPLTAILGWSRMLQTNGFDEAAARRALETIERNARTQTQLIDDLLDVSRIITGKLRLDVRAVDLPAVVTAGTETLRPAAEAKDIRLQILLDPHAGPISGDPDRLQQVVWNLVSNAIKFTPKGGRVQVRLERAGSHVEITVSDTGQGIPQEFLPHVFDRFRQVDQTTTRTHGGLGLGLAIVRQLVELHGGTVHVESRGEGKGATFTVSLPLLPVRAERRAAEAEQRVHPKAHTGAVVCPPELNDLRVLVVDDEPDTRELLSAVLTNCGARVTQAGSAAEALEQLGRERFDVLVSDIGMPGEDGYSFIRRVRALTPERGGRTPAAALTAYAREEDRIRSLMAGYQMHVPKPVGPNELAAVVANLAGRTEAV
jgi:PAS domain S-box-containing protein